MTVPVAFGRVLQKWRLSRRISQQDLAAACDLDRTFISLLERGLRQPSLGTLFSLGKALGVEATELVRQTERALKTSDRGQRQPIPSRRL